MRGVFVVAAVVVVLCLGMGRLLLSVCALLCRVVFVCFVLCSAGRGMCLLSIRWLSQQKKVRGGDGEAATVSECPEDQKTRRPEDQKTKGLASKS